MVRSGSGRDMARERGLSLLAIAILCAVLGLMLKAFFYTYDKIQMQDRQNNLNYSMLEIANSLQNYLSMNHQYPCPAAIRNINSNNVAYGVATDCTDKSVPIGSCGTGAKAYCVTEYPPGSNQRIRIGALPFRDLNIDKEDILDVYNNQYTYAVTETQAVKASYNVNSFGDIHLHDTNPVHNACYILGQNGCVAGHAVDSSKNLIVISSGPDHMGAYSPEGVLSGIACTGTGLDVQNCLWTKNASLMGGTFNSAPYGTQAGANHFDDIILTDTDLWKWVYVWDQASADPNSIYNRLPNYMGVGTNTPRQKLEVDGDLRVESASAAANIGNIQTNGLCTDAPDGSKGLDCFPSSLLGGSGMSCNGSGLMAGLANSAPECVTSFGNVSGGCSGNAFVTGFNYTYGAGLSLTVTCTDVSGASAGNPPLK